MGDWIKLSDSLPKKYKKVLVSPVTNDHPHYRLYAEWSGAVWTSFDLNGCGWKRDDVTHWKLSKHGTQGLNTNR